MKTITIKLPEAEAKELENFVRKRNYPSQSEFIRHLIMEKLDHHKKESIGWMVMAEQSMQRIWNNKKDDRIWSKYL